MKKTLGVVTGLFLVITFSLGQADMVPGPAFKEVLSLKSVGSPVISPDGRTVLYSIRQADWDKNRYDSEIWMIKKGEKPFPLTRTKEGSSSSPAW